MEHSEKAKKNSLRLYVFLFVGSVLAFWINRIAFMALWVRGYKQAADILRVFEFILFGLTLIFVVILIVKILKNREAITQLIAFVLLSAHIVMIFVFTAGWGQSVVVMTDIVTKRVNGGEHSFVINNGSSRANVELECDKAIYDELIMDENVQYVISYRVWLIDSKRGFLESIDTQDFIDNRR